MIVIPDTSALVELIKGTEKGKAVLEILNESELVIIPTLVLAELSSFLERNGVDLSIVETIADMGLVVPLDKEVAINAGKLHAEIRRKNKNKHVSLADCIISKTAKRYGALVVTTDHHVQLLGDALIIEG
ncbi:PIN domain-containing protein [Thermococcus sp.]|uniref:PIN domain-containing protein n=1 Tax=Thermococcus sp. TaxID=35749 RepID=UPI0026289AB4|nr:PIN domain-containing protein [Thermococcus sp.]